MRSFLLFLLVSFISSSPLRSQLNDSNSVFLNTSQADLLIDLMHYIKETHGEYTINNFNVDSAERNIVINTHDIYLNEKIEKLLAHHIYDYFADLMQASIKDSVIKGKDAYRLAFTYLPWLQINMSAGYIQRLTKYFSRGNEIFAQSLTKQVNNNIKSYQDTIFSIVNNVLPDNCSQCGRVNIYFALDGNRGSFAEGNDIIMELSEIKSDNIHNIIYTSAHEMHHVCYGNWLSENFTDSLLNPNEKVLLDWQYRLIYEGSAQLINYNTYPERVKNLYNNRELMLDLFNFWIKSINELIISANPENDYANTRKYMYNELSEQFLKKYSDEKYAELYPYRPSVDYYIGYHLYSTIYDKLGKNGLSYVLLNPQDLLQIFNETRRDVSLLPEIPSETVYLWKQNLNKSKNNL